MSTFEIPGRQSFQKILFDLLSRIKRLEAVPPRAVFEIKLFADAVWPDSVSIVTLGDARFVLAIAEKLDGAYLLQVEAYLTTAGSGDTSVMVRNATGAVDMLLTPVTIPAGETCASTVATDPDNDQVEACDLIALDVDAAGGGDAKGLGVILTFGGFSGDGPSTGT